MSTTGAGARRPGLRVTPYGDRAVLVETPDPVRVAAAARALPGVEDAVPGEGCVVVRGVTSLDLGALAAAPPVVPREHVVRVRYDGPDLPDLPANTAELHAAGVYTVAFLGFAPGFAYLDGLDPALHAPRLDSPRAKVPPGSVGIAGPRTCIYPSASPGGWRLVGTAVEAVLFDPDRDPPALFAPGDIVRFEPC